ncbi:ankyrin repeat protein [Phlyctema vagabunda]|uniref:Ankyrin repeat protein n=1 Tax=Phlyctema vagabunda TaxID=108571 RepID=A0ABR4P2L7_9HELO
MEHLSSKSTPKINQIGFSTLYDPDGATTEQVIVQDCSNIPLMTATASSLFMGYKAILVVHGPARKLPDLNTKQTPEESRKYCTRGSTELAQRVIRRAAADSESTLRDVYTSTLAILFLGTPHRGSSKAGIAEVVRRIVSVSGFNTTDQNIRALQVNSTELELIHELFMKLYEQKDRHFQVLTFQEAKGVVGIGYLKLNERVVEPFSSAITSTEPTQTINANHMSMCRFASKDEAGYKQILGELMILISRIQNREQNVLEKRGEPPSMKADSPSETTTASVSYSLNDVERICISLLVQNTTNVAEYKSSLPSRVAGTCQWILSNSQYRDWNMRKESCLLWITGYPGSGKTILSTYLLEYLGAGEHSPYLRTTLCYFFCDKKIDTQRDAMAILRSIIHQLLMRRRFLIKYVRAAYDFHGPQFEQNFSELWRIFVAIASDKRSGPISVIVDAIDECEETTRNRFLNNVNKLMRESQSDVSNKPCIRFLVTSRPLLGRQYTTNTLRIDYTEKHVEQDLNLVIRAKVEGIVQRTRCNTEVKRYLENALSSKADRTFLWVTLVLHLLEKTFLASQRDFKRIIDELPQTLTTTYESFLHGISAEYESLASSLLHFLVASSRPLTLKEIRVIIAIQEHHKTLLTVEEDAQPNIQETIEGVLGPLIRIWDSRIYLVHESLKEFLQNLATRKDNPLSATYGIDPRTASLLLAEKCVLYLSLDDLKRNLFTTDHPEIADSPIMPIPDSDEVASVEEHWDPFDLGQDTFLKDPHVYEAELCSSIEEQHSLFDYSARYWAEHFSTAYSVRSPDFQEAVAKLVYLSHHSGSNWFRYYWHYAGMNLPYPRDFPPVVTASYFGLTVLLKGLLQDSSAITQEIGICGLYWAARMGHIEVVDLLLSANVHPDKGLVNGQNPLIAAVQFDRLNVAKRLLEDEGFISDRGEYRVNLVASYGRTPLSVAAGNGFVEVARQLLKHRRIEPDIADVDCWTPLFWAVGGKSLEMLQLLVTDERISINHVDKSDRDVLSWAAAEGELDFVRYLMSLSHVQVDRPDRNGRTPFSWAAGNGHLETTVYLRRNQRIDVSRKDRDGRNALSWACSGGHHRVVAYIVKHDRQGVDEGDVDGWTPLAWALTNERPKTMQALLDTGLVNVNRKDEAGRSVLSFAAGYGYLEVVQVLLKTRGIEIQSKDNDGRTPLSYAAPYPEILNVLQSSL